MRSLVVGEAFPWPARSGGTIRLVNAIEALSELGEVDLFTFYDGRLRDLAVPEDAGIARVKATPYLPFDRPRLRRALWLALHRAPFEIALRSSERGAREEFDSWAADSYDVVWFSRVATYAWLGRPDLGPTVVDFHDLEDAKERQRAQHVAARPAHGRAARIRRWAAAYVARRNADDWERVQRTTAAAVDRVVLCSDLDVARSGLPNASTVVNAVPDRPTSATPPSLEPTGPIVAPRLIFQGTFDYRPNIEGAEWLVEAIGPRIRETLPEAQIRLVGQTTPAVTSLDSPPQVTVVGFVPSMGDELDAADIAVVPLRSGSGTRFKILESFAYGVPVVSTSLGAEGLDVEDGVHLLVADDPSSFAEAVDRLCRDAPLRRRLTEAGRERFLERYESGAARKAIKELVTGLGHPE